ncbi:hypothetical protein CPB86DRAFT_779332 [Serendipita vermifera]|nr:hypothetical protein CPB86DRAFT_779332 [Serendipita vermifera]
MYRQPSEAQKKLPEATTPPPDGEGSSHNESHQPPIWPESQWWLQSGPTPQAFMPREHEDVAAIYTAHPEQAGPSQPFASPSDHFRLVSGDQHALIYADSPAYGAPHALHEITGSIPNPQGAAAVAGDMTRIESSPLPHIDVHARLIASPDLWATPVPVSGESSLPVGPTGESLSPPVLGQNTLNAADFTPLSPAESDGSYMDSAQAETSLAGQSRDLDEPFPNELVSIGGGNWKCQICNQQFRRKRRALTHFLNNHGNTKLTCGGRCGKPHCTKTFPSHETLATHLKPANVECPNCKRIVLKKNIQRHQSHHCHP